MRRSSRRGSREGTVGGSRCRVGESRVSASREAPLPPPCPPSNPRGAVSAGSSGTTTSGRALRESGRRRVVGFTHRQRLLLHLLHTGGANGAELALLVRTQWSRRLRCYAGREAEDVIEEILASVALRALAEAEALVRPQTNATFLAGRMLGELRAARWLWTTNRRGVAPTASQVACMVARDWPAPLRDARARGWLLRVRHRPLVRKRWMYAFARRWSLRWRRLPARAPMAAELLTAKAATDSPPLGSAASPGFSPSPPPHPPRAPGEGPGRRPRGHSPGRLREPDWGPKSGGQNGAQIWGSFLCRATQTTPISGPRFGAHFWAPSRPVRGARPGAPKPGRSGLGIPTLGRLAVPRRLAGPQGLRTKLQRPGSGRALSYLSNVATTS